MILGFDIGNTNTLAGLYKDSDILPAVTFRYPTDKLTDEKKLFDTIKDFIETESGQLAEPMKQIVYSSVVPEINDSIDRLAKSYFGVNSLSISHKNNLSVKLMYDDPSKLGADRIANAEAAHREYSGDSLIIDVGTAATICVLLADGTFDGGLIVPGIGTMIKSLAASASNLPEISFGKPDRLVAKDTINAVKSGFFYGWYSFMDGIISRIEQDYEKKFSLIFTGGFAKTLVTALERPFFLDEMLTMKGIKYIYDNHQKAAM